MKPFLRNLLIIICSFFVTTNSYAKIYDWTGAVSTDWSNAANWQTSTGSVTINPATTYPGSIDTARIGVLALTNTSNFPVISPGGATSVGNIVWGTENYLIVSLAVNTSFTVNGNIENTATVAGNGNVSAYVFNLSGTGSLTITGSLFIGYDDGFTPLNPGNNNTFTFNSAVNQFTVSGGVNLNSYQGDTHHRGFLPYLNITSGTMTTSSIQSSLVNANVYNSTLAASVTVGNSSGTPTATLQLTGANALPTFSPYIVNTLTFDNPGATVEYSGASQTVYTDASVANLSNTIAYNNIKFSGTGVKTASGGNLNVAGDFINTMANDANNYLSLSALGSPSTNKVNFDGTTQSLQGGSGNGTTFYNVAFSNSGTKTMTSGNFQVADVGVLTMSGSNTKLNAGSGLLTLISDGTSTATVAAIPAGCSISGTVNVQRFVKGSYPTDLSKRSYRLMSSTVYTGTVSGINVYDINYLLNSVFISGATGGGFNATPSTNPSTYLYREDIVPSDVNFTTGFWKGIAKINNPNAYDIGIQKRLTIANVADTTVNIPVGNGFLFFFRGNKTVNGSTTGTKTTLPYNYPEDVTLTQVGTLNAGTVNVKLWFANSANNLGNKLSYTTTIANAVDRGFTFVGNPYASTINWEKYNRNSSPALSSIYGSNGLGSTIYLLNATTKQYEAYMQKTGTITSADTTTNLDPGTAVESATNMIASGEGFFIRASATTQTLSFRETAKTTTQPSVAKMNNLMGKPKESFVAAEPLIRLQMIEDAINNDEIVIRLNNETSTAYSSTEDAEDMGGVSALVSMSVLSSDSVKLCINRLPFPKKTAQVIPVTVDATNSGNYQLKLSQVTDLPQVYNLWLRDNLTHDSVNMREAIYYSFNIDLKKPATFGTKRFQLVISQNPRLNARIANFDATKTDYGALLRWKTEHEYNNTAYYIERSIDKGANFEPIGSMRSDGSGSYTFVDKKPAIGEDDYRLKQVDLNNDISYSNVAKLFYSLVSDNTSNISVFPNPAVSTINLTMNQNSQKGTYSIRIINSAGTVVKESSSQQAAWKGNIGDLKPGTYVVQVTNSQSKSVVGITSFVKD